MPGLIHIVGARPNFIKAAPVIAALGSASAEQQLIHTGQHYDRRMSEIFFEELGLPEPLVVVAARALERDPDQPRWVTTVWGVGYKFAAGGDFSVVPYCPAGQNR